MKLLKLVYIAHGWHLAQTGQPLFRESVEAWRYGPVVRELYDRFSVHGAGPIACRVRMPRFNDTTKSILETVWNVYSPISARDLSRMTHLPGTPWKDVFAEGLNRIITADSIRDHFRELAQRSTQQLVGKAGG